MQPYEFNTSSAQLVEQQGGQWIAKFEAAIYEDQVYDETGNSINEENIRVISFDVVGSENEPLSYQEGNSGLYTRGSETEVELVLYRNGSKKGSFRVVY